MRTMYSDAEIKAVLQSLTVLCDTREQANDHITSYFERNNIPHKTRKLATADYTAALPALPEYGINRPVCFDNSIVIERKGCLEELSGNLTNERGRLKNEFMRARGKRIYLIIEGSSLDDIINHNYNTRFSERAFYASLLALQESFNINVLFTSKPLSGKHIYSLLYYHVRNYLLGGSNDE